MFRLPLIDKLLKYSILFFQDVNPISHGLFLNRQSFGGGGGGGEAYKGHHHNFVLIAPMIMKFGTGIKLDIFYTMVTKKFVTSLRNYDITAGTLADT